MMKRWAGLIVMAGIVAGAGSAFGQTGPYRPGAPGYGVASDFGAPPYAELPPQLPRRRYEAPAYDGPDDDAPRYAPAVLPPTAIYGILRDNGYSPLGVPQQRGLVYTISVISPDGDDGRLVVDARTGRILRFMPAYRMGDRMADEIAVAYGPSGPLPPVGAALPSVGMARGVPRPLETPKIASRTPVPLPKPMPLRAAARPMLPPAPALATVKTDPANAQAAIATPPAGAAAPAVRDPAAPLGKTAPTPSGGEMPAAQGLE